MKPAGGIVTLTDHNPDSLVKPGDGMMTPTGRRYRVLERQGRRLTCVVLGPAEPWTEGGEWLWTWAWRGKHG